MDDWKLEPSPSVPAPRSAPRRLRWWFLRVAGVRGPSDLAYARTWVARAGRVWDEGCGTAAAPDAGWFVVRARCETVAELRGRLGEDHVAADLIEEIPHRAHAATLVRQLPLIG